MSKEKVRLGRKTDHVFPGSSKDTFNVSVTFSRFGVRAGNDDEMRLMGFYCGSRTKRGRKASMRDSRTFFHFFVSDSLASSLSLRF